MLSVMSVLHVNRGTSVRYGLGFCHSDSRWLPVLPRPATAPAPAVIATSTPRAAAPSGVRLAGCVLTFVLLAPPVDAQPLDRYRDHVLGAAQADVVAATGARLTDVKTLHERPAVVKQLEWRTPYAGLEATGVDPVRDIRFGFLDGRLYELVVTYAHDRTKGLTTAELVDGVAAVYGAPGPKRPVAAMLGEVALGTVVLGHWRDDSATLTLVRGPYEDVMLIMRSVRLGEKATAAIAAALALDDTEAPARAQRLRDDEKATRAAERARNRSAFRP